MTKGIIFDMDGTLIDRQAVRSIKTTESTRLDAALSGEDSQ